MSNLESIINSMPDRRFELLKALKILADAQVFSLLARANANQLVDERMDFENEVALANEIREHRQTNRILLGLEESAREMTKELENA